MSLEVWPVSSAVERIEISPHCSLSGRGAVVFFASLCAVCFVVAGLVAARGFWPVLAFAALEMLVLGWALGASMGRRHHRETITVSDHHVAVETRDRGRAARVVFMRHWSRVTLQRGFSPLHPSRLAIESQGRRCEIGSFLTETQREDLARRLRQLIGRVNESPLLAP